MEKNLEKPWWRMRSITENKWNDSQRCMMIPEDDFLAWPNGGSLRELNDIL